jgi:hypothetical protein
MAKFNTTNGSKFSISSAAVADTVDDLTGYEALTFTEIKEIEDLGELGDVATEVTGTTIGDGRVRKAKGARNAGTMAVIAFHVALEPGQVAAIAAEATKDDYAFKLEIADKPSPTGTGTIQYFRGMVMSKALRLGTNDNIIRRVLNIAVNSEITEDPATVGV